MALKTDFKRKTLLYERKYYRKDHTNRNLGKSQKVTNEEHYIKFTSTSEKVLQRKLQLFRNNAELMTIYRSSWFWYKKAEKYSRMDSVRSYCLPSGTPNLEEFSKPSH